MPEKKSKANCVKKILSSDGYMGTTTYESKTFYIAIVYNTFATIYYDKSANKLFLFTGAAGRNIICLSVLRHAITNASEVSQALPPVCMAGASAC